MISEYGFYVSRNSYYGAGRGNADVRWSNFILEPIVHVKDDQNARRLFRMRNDKGEESVINSTSVRSYRLPTSASVRNRKATTSGKPDRAN